MIIKNLQQYITFHNDMIENTIYYNFFVNKNY